jgi:DNA-binding GntR family transcriptional regulator
VDFRIGQVDVTTIQERVYDRLRLALQNGRFLPGETITIRGLAEQMGTSEMPVREAIQRLVAESALVKTSSKKICVAPFDSHAYAEVTRIRMKVEGFAASRAATLCRPGLLAELEAANEEMRAAGARRDLEAAVAANKAFHFTVYDAAEYPVLSEIIANLWLRAGPFIATSQRSMADPRVMFGNGYQVHQRVIASIERGDRRAAEHFIALDIRSATLWLVRQNKLASSVAPKTSEAAKQAIAGARRAPGRT